MTINDLMTLFKPVLIIQFEIMQIVHHDFKTIFIRLLGMF